MKTCEWTERVALSVDVPDAGVDAHLSGCSECRQLRSDLLADASLLREAPDVPEAALRTVRTRVLHQVRPSRRWLPVAAALAIAAVGAGWWMTRLPDVERLEIAVSAPAAPELIRPAPASPPARRAAPPRPVRPDGAVLAMALRDMLEPEVRPTVSADVPVVMRIQTEDPDVVIVLLSDSRGGD